MNFAEKHPFFLTRTGSLVLHFGLAVTGACSAAMFPALNWSLLAWIALLPLILLCRSCSVRSAFLRGLTWGYFWSLFSFLWLREIALPIPFILSFVLALFVAAWSAYYNFLWRHLSVAPADRLEGGAHCAELVPFRRPLHGIFFMLANAGMWCVLEWLRGWIMTGLPWDYLGTAQWRNLPLIQICEFTGVFGVSFLVAAVNLGLGLALVSFRPGSGWGRAYRSPWPLLAAFALLLACYVSGLHLLRANRLDESAVRHVNIGVIQPNLSQRRNADHAAAKEALDVCTDLTERLLDRDEKLRNLVPVGNAPNRKLDLIVWPETAVPYAYRGGAELSREYRDRIGALLRRHRVPFLIGSIDFQVPEDSPENYKVFNAALLITEPGGSVKDFFYKYHRVPFGEYVPFGDTFPELNELVGMGRNLTAGRRCNPLEALPGVRIGTSICFESVFPFLSRGHAYNGANLLLIIANDAWYPTSWESDQHFANGLFRAVETRLPLLRSGNSNYSALISPRGEVLDTISLGCPERTEKVFRVPVPVNPKPTFYTRFGNLFVVFCAFLAFCGFAAAFVNWKLFRAGQLPEEIDAGERA